MPIEHFSNPHNQEYLRTKAQRMGHLLHHQGLALDEEMIHEERRHDRERDAEDEGGGGGPRGSANG